MPTTEQLIQRSELIQSWIRDFEKCPPDELTALMKATPRSIYDSVFAGAYELGVLNADQFTPKQALRIAERFLKECSDRHRDKAANRGSEVHAIAEAIANGEKVDVPPELRGHVDSWMNFVRDYGIVPVRTEFTVYSLIDNYAGTGDLLCTSTKHPELGLIAADYKTSESGIWPEISLQLAALRFAEFIWAMNPDTGQWYEDRETLKQIKTFWGIQITGEGYKVVPVSANAAVFNVFRDVAVVAHFRREYMSQVLGDAEFVPNKKELGADNV